MKIVQTFWTGNQSVNPSNPLLEFKCGWRSSEYHWISWTFSCFKLLELYGQVELVTDKRGKEILIDTLQLPYTSVSLALEEELGDIHPELFSLAKIKTYSLQTEPFLHVDGDLFLFQAIDQTRLGAPLISSNPEADLHFNAHILRQVHAQDFWLPEHLRNVHKHPHIFSSNAGIIGGNDLAFIKDYCEIAEEIVARNHDKLDQVDTGNLNFMIEQISFFYLAQQRQVPIAYASPEPVTDPLYHDFISLSDIPNVVMAHAAGGCKRSDFMLSHMLRRFRLYYPDDYYRIINLCNDTGVETSTYFYQSNRLEWNSQTSEPVFEKRGTERIDSGTDFSMGFGRTIKVINHLRPDTQFKDIDELAAYMEREELPGQCHDIYQIELAIRGVLDEVHDPELWDGRYKTGVAQYAAVAMASEAGAGLIDSKEVVMLAPDMKSLKVGWNWWKRDDDEMELAVTENFKAEPSEVLLIIVPDLINFKASAYYPDQLDGLIISMLEEPMSIEEILLGVSKAFEDDIDPVSNMGYRQLILDVIKRLLFNNILSYQKVIDN